MEFLLTSHMGRLKGWKVDEKVDETPKMVIKYAKKYWKSFFAGKSLADFRCNSTASCLLYFAIITPTIPARTHKETFNHIIVQMFFFHAFPSEEKIEYVVCLIICKWIVQSIWFDLFSQSGLFFNIHLKQCYTKFSQLWNYA